MCVCFTKGVNMLCSNHICSITQLKCDGTRWRTGGEVKGKLANGVGSQYSSHYPEHGVSSITTADAHTSAAISRLDWRPRLFKWTRPFHRKTKSDFCACPITFKLASAALSEQSWAQCLRHSSVSVTSSWCTEFLIVIFTGYIVIVRSIKNRFQ